MKMKKQLPVMPSLEVLVERLPQAVLDSAIGPIKVLQEKPVQDIKSIKSLHKLKSVKTKAIMRDVTKKSMPILQVTLERLPTSLMTSLLAQKKIYVKQEKRKVGRPKKIRNHQVNDEPPMFDFISV